MNGLALCAGIGGLELGLKIALGDSYRTVCYVEREAYPAACLVARMEEGFLDKAPIWDDLTSFDGSAWCGVVDVVTAGFPCQPFSQAGKRLKEADKRHIWPEIARIIGEAAPTLVFLENVAIRAYKEPYRDLRDLGFTLSDPYAATAAEMGAGHLRRRVFVLAWRDNARRTSLKQTQGRLEEPQEGVLAYHYHQRRIQQEGLERAERRWIGDSGWWSREPELERVVHGIPNRVDRDRALGNAVVPIVAAKAFLALYPF